MLHCGSSELLNGGSEFEVEVELLRPLLNQRTPLYQRTGDVGRCLVVSATHQMRGRVRGSNALCRCERLSLRQPVLDPVTHDCHATRFFETGDRSFPGGRANAIRGTMQCPYARNRRTPES